MAKAAFHKKKSLFTSKLDLNLRKKHMEHSFVCAGTWTLPKIDQKYLESFDMWCWRRIETSWTDCEKVSITKGQGGEEYPTKSKKKEVKWDWSHLAQELPSKVFY